jgi:hypothetical protein
MRTAFMAVVAVLGLIALPAPVTAAPAAPDRAVIAPIAPDIHYVRGGCGAGWHPQAWRDRWGNWHRRCVPNRW